MSRDYYGWCPECQKEHAVVGFIHDDENSSYNLVWCKETGKFWKEITHWEHVKLNITGKTEKDWKKAERLFYDELQEGLI